MEEVLYKSDGNPPKRKKAMRICAILEIVCGGLLFIVSTMLWGDAKMFCLLLGLGAIGVGALMLCAEYSSAANKAKLYLYDKHIEGIQTSPYKEFCVLYSEISDVQKITFFSNPMLIVQCGKETYTVLTDDVDTAYSIICDKVYGEV